jgi:hypothetical protein
VGFLPISPKTNIGSKPITMQTILERAFELSEQGLAEPDPARAREVMFAAITAFEAVQATLSATPADMHLKGQIASAVAHLKQKRADVARHVAQLEHTDRQLELRLQGLSSTSAQSLQVRLDNLKQPSSTAAAAAAAPTLEQLNERFSRLSGKPPLDLSTSRAPPLQPRADPAATYQQQVNALLQEVMDEIALEHAVKRP